MSVTNSPGVALITGATGFIGGQLARRLLEEGWSIRLMVRDSNKLAAQLQSSEEVVKGDLLDQDALAHAVKDAQVIFHCAANVATWDSWDSYYSANVQGVQNLLNAISRGNPGLSRLVHVSTVDVYGFPASPCDEKCATSGAGFGYGETKLRGETLVREYCDQNNIPYTIIRPCNVIGPGSQFISRIGQELKSGLMLTVNGGRTNAGLVYIDNLIDYMIWAAQADNARGECYNVRDDYDVDWKTFLSRFRGAINGRGIIINLPFIVADTFALILEKFHKMFLPVHEPLLHRLLVRFFGRTCGHSADKIRIDSGFASKVGFDEAMNRSYKWFLEQVKAK